jgi:hypothetical protein
MSIYFPLSPNNLTDMKSLVASSFFMLLNNVSAEASPLRLDEHAATSLSSAAQAPLELWQWVIAAAILIGATTVGLFLKPLDSSASRERRSDRQ